MMRIQVKNILIIVVLLVLVAFQDARVENDIVIIGLWKFESKTVNGELGEFNKPCPSLIFFEAENFKVIQFSGDSCMQSDTRIVSYSISGNTLRTVFDGYEAEVEIISLTKTTLKIEQSNGGEVTLETYTRL